MFNSLRERLAFDQFHDESAVVDAVDGRDVGMVQRCEQLSFALEPGDALGVLGEGVGKDLEGDLPLEPGVQGAIDLAHAAGAERRNDLIWPEKAASHQ